jgi:hypothetical protein
MKAPTLDFEARLTTLAELTQDTAGGLFSALHRETLADLEQALSAGQITRERALQLTVRVQHLLVARAAYLRMRLDGVFMPTPMRAN